MGNSVNGLVLAGGRSSRMGHDKAMIMFDGETQLDRAVSLLSRHVDKVYVSSRDDQAGDPERDKYAQILDRYTDIGPAAGILSALESDGSADWLVLACDLPNVDDETIAYLLANRSSRHSFTAYASTHDALPEPLCAIFHSGSESQVRRFVEGGIVCPRKMLIKSDTCLLQQPEPHALDNINTPDDLARVRSRATQ